MAKSSRRGNTGPRKMPEMVHATSRVRGELPTANHKRQPVDAAIEIHRTSPFRDLFRKLAITILPALNPIQNDEAIHCALPSVSSRYRVANKGVQPAMLASIPPYNRKMITEIHETVSNPEELPR
jgi:hypothetical protein